MRDKPKIMVVDDNPMNREVLAEALEDKYEVAMAEDGMVALAIAGEFNPDVVLLDVMMPGRDGFDVCRCIKSSNQLRQTRIIMVSARAELAARLKGYEAGADDYVTKPFCEDELLTKVTFALRTKRLQGLCGATGEVLALLSEMRDTDVDPDMLSIRAISHLLAVELRNTGASCQIDDQFLDDLHYASVLRDVGLMSIPSGLLNKIESWTIDEVEHIKQHTLVGASLLNRLASEHPSATMLRMAADVARSHHEQFDGRGYPDRLAADHIPLAARLVYLAELINSQLAVHSDSDSARAEVESNVLAAAGAAFDGNLANVAIKVLAEVQDIDHLEELALATAE